MSMYVRPVTKEIEEIARTELNEKPVNREHCLKHVGEWIAKRHQLNFRTDGLWLLNFMRGCKFSTQIAKQKLEAYLSLKLTVPEIFDNRDPLLPAVQGILTSGAIIPFATPDKDCVIIRWEVINPDKVEFLDLMKVAIMILDVFMNESDTCMALGHYIIIDFKGFSINFLKHFGPSVMRKAFYNILIAYPSRIKAIYMVNCIGCVETLFSLAKPFVSKKILARASFHGKEFCDVYETIPQKYFPIEYGGSGDSVAELTVVWKKKIESYRDWYLEGSNYCLGSSLKGSNRSNGSTNVYGSEGSFRKLEID